MVDKYAHKAPRRPRQCYKADGTRKVRWSEPQAVERAAEFEGYHAYRCPTCNWWHIGRERE